MSRRIVQLRTPKSHVTTVTGKPAKTPGAVCLWTAAQPMSCQPAVNMIERCSGDAIQRPTARRLPILGDDQRRFSPTAQRLVAGYESRTLLAIDSPFADSCEK
jgi:hypothetical protein